MELSDYVGIPFVKLGRDRSGCDCYGLVYVVYKEKLGVELPKHTEYTEIISDETAAIIESEKIHWKEVSTPRTYDVVLIRVKGVPQHIGIVVKEGWMLHTAEGKNSCIERYTRPYWSARIEGFYRYELN